MPSEHIVVDGSNIATEGRSAPSLAQLEEAVSELKREFPDAEVTVIVDATFAHRIDPSELERFEDKALKGEYIHPPAGAIGRGDAFLLRVAEKVNAVTLSNDSFQEFHGEHPWLFERGRLYGATPVPGVGWIFTPRTPVRGPKSRRATKDTEKEKRKISRAIEAATKEAVSPKSKPREPAARRSKDASAAEAQAPESRANPAVSVVNDPLSFISFIAEHPLGTEVQGRVESYTSHGAVVFVNGTQCYVPLANMAAPPPRSAREVLKRDEERTFVVTALDPQRRGVELAVPGVAEVSGRPSEEMIAAEVSLAKRKASTKRAPAKRPATRRQKSSEAATPEEARPSRGTSRKQAAPSLEIEVAAAPSPETEAPAAKALRAPRVTKKATAGPAKKAAAGTAKKVAATAAKKAVEEAAQEAAQEALPTASKKKAAPSKKRSPARAAAKKATEASPPSVEPLPTTRARRRPARSRAAEPTVEAVEKEVAAGAGGAPDPAPPAGRKEVSAPAAAARKAAKKRGRA